MSVGSLISMRPTWLLGQHFSLAGNPHFQPRLTAAGIANTERITPANAQSSYDVDAFHTIQAAPNGQKAYAFLPWRPGGVTYMEVDPNCQLVMTGPLSACNICAFESAGQLVLVHANANAGTSWADMTALQKTANMNTKQNAINAIKAQYAAPVDIANLIYANFPGAPLGARTYEGFMGFVLGCKPRAGYSLNKVSWTKSSGRVNWTFYFYGYNGMTAADRVLWAL